ncbi:MAG: hypothetical protein HQL72_08985 [Magnetococcales bacterium]|nr:hypothetical protein [Magnetococcales bacterium]
MTRNGTVYQLPPLVRLTRGTGSGLWLTPRASDTAKGEGQTTFLKRMGDRTDRCAQSLAAQVRMPKTWPTPTAAIAKQGVNQPDGKRGQTLLGAVQGQLWPTPRCGDGMTHKLRIGSKRLEGTGARGRLEDAVALTMWPTPLSRDHRSGKVSQKSLKRNSRPLNEMVTAADPTNNGRLNPDWVEGMMGFPRGWTDLGNGEFQE